MLYIVGTPIGNLDDLSYRQARTIMSSDILLTEDTRSTGILLKVIEEVFPFKRNPDQKMISYYKDKELEKLPEIIAYLEQAKEVALISQAGMPVISDPGYLLIKTAIQKGISFTVIPGPSAVTTAIVHSGHKSQEWMYIGFLPKKEGQIKTVLERVKDTKRLWKNIVCVAFESPNRIQATLALIAEILPDSEVVVTRELTKKFEEITRGKAMELMNREYRGEITLIF
jgi:16S rRNA (cytidine1402-2'-O)-methyltransferase